MITVTRSSIPQFEEYCEEIKDIWDSHWLTNMGPKHKAFQQQLEEYLNCSYVELFTNGHLALENAIAVYNFPKGSEIITTPYTFASTTHAIVRNGLCPVFCDINDYDYTIDVNKIEDLITDRTVAILPVHVYGHICDVESIERIARQYNLKVIYDAAHAFGVTYKGKSVANYGDISIFSFHATKVFNTIEGGAVCFKDDNLQLPLYESKNFGIRDYELCASVGGNAKMSEFQAAMGICNLRHIKEEIEKRRIVAQKYNERLLDVPGIIIPKIKKNVKPNYAYYPVIFDNFKKNRDKVWKELFKKEILARKYFFPLTNDFECYRDYPTAGAGKTPVAKYVSDRVLTLPLYPNLTVDDVDMICDILLK